MKIVYLNPDNTVREILPEATYEKGAEFWYGAEFAKRCVEAPNDVEQGFVYDPEAGTFAEAEPTKEQPTGLEIMRADLDYVLMIMEG